MNNATLATADRATHLKVVALALAASTVVAVIGIGLHVAPADRPATVLRTAGHSIDVGG